MYKCNSRPIAPKKFDSFTGRTERRCGGNTTYCIHPSSNWVTRYLNRRHNSLVSKEGNICVVPRPSTQSACIKNMSRPIRASPAPTESMRKDSVAPDMDIRRLRAKVHGWVCNYFSVAWINVLGIKHQHRSPRPVSGGYARYQRGFSDVSSDECCSPSGVITDCGIAENCGCEACEIGACVAFFSTCSCGTCSQGRRREDNRQRLRANRRGWPSSRNR